MARRNLRENLLAGHLAMGALCMLTGLSALACTESSDLSAAQLESIESASLTGTPSHRQYAHRGDKPRGLRALLAFLGRHDEHHDEHQCQEPDDTEDPAPQCTFADISEGMRTGPFSQLLFDPMIPGRAYAVDAGILYVSDDGARSFAARQVTAPTDLAVALVAPVNGTSTLYAKSSRGLVRTDDGGLTYEELGLRGLDIKALHVHPADATQVYVSTYQGGLLRSVNGGRSFTAINGGLPSAQNYAVAMNGDPLNSTSLVIAVRGPDFVAGNENHLFRTDSMGAGWTSIEGTAFPSASLSRCNADPSVLVAGIDSQRGLLYSSDNGETFALKNFVFGASSSVNGVIGGEQCEVIYASVYPDGMYRSTDGGATFARLPAVGIDQPLLSPREMIVDPNDAAVLVARFDGGTYRSQDGGNSFEPVRGIGTPTITDVQVSQGTSQQIWVSTWGGGAFHKDTQGAPFVHVPGSALPMAALATIERAVNGGPILAGGFPTLYSSVDDGQTFTELDRCYYIDFLVDPRDPQVIYGATYECGVKRSDDGGRSFLDNSDGLLPPDLAASSKPTAVALLQDPNDRDRLFVGHERFGVFVRENDNTPFVQSLATPDNRVSALETDGSAVYAAVAGLGVAVSRDGGSSWSYANDGLPTRSVVDLQWDEIGGVLYASAAEGLFRLVGGTWQPFEENCVMGAGPIALVSEGSARGLVIGQGRRIIQQPLD